MNRSNKNSDSLLKKGKKEKRKGRFVLNFAFFFTGKNKECGRKWKMKKNREGMK